MGRRHRHDRVRRVRLQPTVALPRGVTPPIKEIIGERFVNGKKEYVYSYYCTSIPVSAIKANGNPADLEIALATAPIITKHDDPDVIDFDTYVKEQLGVIAREKELIYILKATGPTFEDDGTWLRLFTELKETSARRNRPSKDWKPFTGIYRLPRDENLPEPIRGHAPCFE